MSAGLVQRPREHDDALRPAALPGRGSPGQAPPSAPGRSRSGRQDRAGRCNCCPRTRPSRSMRRSAGPPGGPGTWRRAAPAAPLGRRAPRSQLRSHLAYLKLRPRRAATRRARASREGQARLHPVPARPAPGGGHRDRAAPPTRPAAVRELPAHQDARGIRLHRPAIARPCARRRARDAAIGAPGPVSHCPPCDRHWSNSPVAVLLT